MIHKYHKYKNKYLQLKYKLSDNVMMGGGIWYNM